MKHPRWPLIRAAVQILCWTVFIALIVGLRFPVESTWPYKLITRFSVHLGIATSLSSKALAAFLPGVILLAFAVILGRYFCGWLCPLGSTIDFSDRFFLRKKAIQKTGGTEKYRRLKYIVLTISFATAVAGLQVAGIIDPLSMATRSYIILYSYLDRLIKLAFAGLSGISLLARAADSAQTSLQRSLLDPNNIAFNWHGAVLLVFLAVLFISVFSKRFWCRNLCPLGACHALVSGLGFFRRRVDEDRCVKCRACENRCRMGAIRGEGLLTDEPECIRCMECLKSCPHDAISFSFGLPWKKKISDNVDKSAAKNGMTRRDLIAVMASSAAAIPFIKNNADAENISTYLIRPPGAGAEKRFMELCIRCGQCMKACPTNGLHPAMLESGAEGMFTPRLIPRIGWCEKNCNLCTTVCPTGALRTVSLEERETLIMGTAFIKRDLCIPWIENRNCIVCEEMCPTATKSIRLSEERVVRSDGTTVTVKRPYVLEEICIGCGICENKCPVRGSAAIRVRRRKREPKAAGTSLS